MKLKNIVLATVGAAALIVGSSAFASAPTPLTTRNSSSYYSSVKINGVKCSGKLMNQWTGPVAGHTKLDTPWFLVKLMCANKTECTATLYLSKNTDAETCVASSNTGETMTMNTATGMVTSSVSSITVKDGGGTASLAGGDHLFSIS